MDPDRVEERDLTRAEGLLEEEGAGVGEEGPDVGADCQRLRRPVEAGDGLGRYAEHVAGVLGVSEDAEGGLVDGDHAAEGLDEAAALDPEEVGGDLVFGEGVGGGGGGVEVGGVGVVEGLGGLPGLFEDGVEAGVFGVLGDGFADGVGWVCRSFYC